MIRTVNNLQRCSRLPLCWLLCAALAGPAAAQELQFVDPFGQDLTLELPDQGIGDLANVQLDPALLEVVRHLDDPAFDKREEAAQTVVEKAGDKIQLYAILDHGNLTIEQRYRLLQIVREYLLDMPRGAVGISMAGWQPGMALQGGGVRVADLIPGMPAERVLQVGDRIMAIDGHALATQTDLLVYVQTKRPGDRISMSIKRSKVDDRGDLVLDERNQVMTDDLVVELELGSFETLKNTQRGEARPSPVAQQRAREAGEVADKFAPTPTALMVTGENGQAFAFTSSDTDDTEPDIVDARADTHPLVRKLLRDFELIDGGRITLTPELRRQWYQELQLFAQVTAQADMGEEMRLMNERVIARYSQLLNSRLRKVAPAP